MEVKHLTPEELAKRWRMKEVTLANWRWRGGGPKYFKIGKKIFYPIAEVEAFEKAQLKRNTAQ